MDFLGSTIRSQKSEHVSARGMSKATRELLGPSVCNATCGRQVLQPPPKSLPMSTDTPPYGFRVWRLTAGRVASHPTPQAVPGPAHTSVSSQLSGVVC